MDESTLLRLPVELLSTICALLDPESSKSLRLVCRDVNNNTLHAFAQLNFHELHVKTSEAGLNRLLTISQHAEFSLAVRTLKLWPHYATCFNESKFRISQEGSWYAVDEQALMTKAKRKHAEALARQKAFLDRGGDRLILTEAFQKLPNIDGMEINRYRRTKKQRLPSWARYSDNMGWPLVCENPTTRQASGPNRLLRVYDCRLACTAVDHVLRVVHSALSQSEVALKVLKIGSSNGEYESVGLGALSRLLSKANNALSGLTKLHLEVHTGSPYRDSGANAATLADMLTMTPSLTTLWLSFDHDEFEVRSGDMLQDMLRYTQLPKLRNFSFKQGMCRGSDLAAFLKAHKAALHKLRLEDVVFSDANWRKPVCELLDPGLCLVTLGLRRFMTIQGLVCMGKDSSSRCVRCASSRLWKDPFRTCDHDSVVVKRRAGVSKARVRLQDAHLQPWAD